MLPNALLLTVIYVPLQANHTELEAKIKAETEKRIRKIKDTECLLQSRIESAKNVEELGYQEVVQKLRGAAASSRSFANKGFDHIQDPSEKVG